MKPQASPLWTTSTTLDRKTGTWRDATPDYRTLPSPCLAACPVDGHIADWIGHLQHQNYRAAWLRLMENNPFPAIAGRICHHPCEQACNRQNLDESIAICGLERFVGDLALEQAWSLPEPNEAQEKSVAIVGAGPAGLSAAYQLRRRGYPVTIFEPQTQLGGLMRYGIPAYRLDKQVLDGEVQRILDLGVKVIQRAIATQPQLEQLQTSFDAVYLATGAARAKVLPGLPYSKHWVVDSAAWLAATHAGEACPTGQHLVVIGGGSAAIDVARSARRLGKSVTVLSLEPEDQLPAQSTEVEEAREEGIAWVCGAMLQQVTEQNDTLTLHCIEVDFLAGTATREFTITPKEDTGFTITADTIVPSIGQDADYTIWGKYFTAQGPILQTGPDWQTEKKGIFAGGDLASRERFVTQAVGMGKQAAAAIARYLEGQPPITDEQTAATVGIDAINTDYYPQQDRARQPKLATGQRLRSFQEVQQPLNAAQAEIEVSRCFSCGTCIFCDNCYAYCPDMAITRLDKSYEVKSEYCKGCGLCVAECPTGSIVMQATHQRAGR